MVEPRDSGHEQKTAPTVEESYSLLYGITSRLEKSLDINNKGLKALRFPMFSLVKTLSGFASDAVNIQRKSLAFNQNFKDIVNEQGNNIKGLPGGLKTSLQSALSFQQAGMFSVGKETLNLANTMQITGQNVAGLVNLNKKVITEGSLSRNEMEFLNASLTDNSLSYGVSTDLLIGAMDRLGEGLTVLGFTGGAGKTLQGIQDLTKKFPELGDKIGAFADRLVTGEFGDFAKLDILPEVNKLLGKGLSSDELVKVIERINKTVSGFGQGANDAASQRMRMSFAGPLGILAKQIGDGIKDFKPNEEQENQAKIFQDFRTSMQTLLTPIALKIGELATAFARVATRAVTFIEELVGLELVIKGIGVLLASNLIISKINASRQAAAMAAQALALGTNTVSVRLNSLAQLGIVGGVIGIGLIVGSLATSVDLLAESEKIKAKAELSKLRNDDSPTRFESLTRMLINTQMRQFETLNSARTNDMTEFTSEVVAAVDRNTNAVDDTAPKPNFRSN